jgi:predicted metal-dependent phosphoesterase TrpH
MSPLRLLRAAAARGLGCIAVTDHDAFGGAVECARLSATDTTLPRVILGEEIRSSAGEIVGLYLREEIPGGLSPVETVARIREQGGLVYLPHPLDGVRGATMDEGSLEAIARAADVIEVSNGRSLRPSYSRKALDLAARLGKPMGAGSDAHFEREVGRAYMEVPGLPERADLLELLRAGRPSPDMGPLDTALGWAYCLATAATKAGRRLHRPRLHSQAMGKKNST